MRRAKIVCTLGPASSTAEEIENLIRAGMDCARLNFSHGSHDSHRELATRVREAARRVGRSVALLGDLCGPKMRVGRFEQDGVDIEVGQRFTLTTDAILGTQDRVSITYLTLPQEVRPQDVILLDDGLLRLRVESTTDTEILCVVEVGGRLSNNKGLNVPHVPLSTPALTEKDRKDLEFAVGEIAVDYLALSFVRSADDVRQAQAIARGTPIIAKIEKPEAIDALEAILDATDGVMIARGDLGVEIGSEKVPLIQKKIIRETNARGKVVITATQMLDSMMRNPRPTRAETADVANAILDGTDAIMLSGETASGRYPIESVQMMAAIVHEVEAAWLDDTTTRMGDPTLIHDWGMERAAAQGAAFFSFVLPLKAIVNFTRDGRSATVLSKYRPKAPIVAMTPNEQVANRLALQWGVFPQADETPADFHEAVRIATSAVARRKLCRSGDAIAIVAGLPLSGPTNTVKLHRM